MNRYAYPASLDRQDVCIHGTAQAAQQAQDMACQEAQEERGQLTPGFTCHITKSQESYNLMPHIRDQVLFALGVDPLSIQVDLFASTENAQCQLFVTKQMDAFTFSWDKLTEDGHHLLWMNPLFSCMAKIITKLILEPCRVVLVAPEWKHEPWWKPLEMLTVSREYLHCQLRAYRGDHQTDSLPPPGWRTTVNLLDTRKWTISPFCPLLVAWVERHCQGKTLHHLLQHHGFQSPKQILVHTRSGLETHESEDEEEEEDQQVTGTEEEEEEAHHQAQGSR